MELVGRVLKIGNRGPDFRVTSQNLKEVRLSDFPGKIKVITSFHSLDTAVCDLQVKEFNKRAGGMDQEVVVLAISKDLPFAQKRFCQAYGIEKVTVLSDYRFSSFGINYGLLIKELNLLARSVLILDKSDILRYFQIVEELTNQPDYEDVLMRLPEVVRNPVTSVKQELPSKCKPCEVGTPPLPIKRVNELMVRHPGWLLVEDKKITREFKFKDFVDAKYFLDLTSIIAEEQGHHPIMTLTYGKLKITLTTHVAKGLTENDFIMARIIDELGGEGE